MRRALPLLLAFLLHSGAAAAEGYRYFEGTAAVVNREVLFLSDVLREQCLLRCAVLPGSRPEELSLEEARSRLIFDTLALQEHEKLALGQVDNAALADRVREARARAAACGSPCAGEVPAPEIAQWVERKLLIQDFLRRRVGVFVEVSDEEAQREMERRKAQGEAGAGLSAEGLRKELRDEKIAKEVRNWQARAASKATITLSPLEEKWKAPTR